MTELTTAWIHGCACGFFIGVTATKRGKQRALDALAQMEDIPTELVTEIRQTLEELPND